MTLQHGKGEGGKGKGNVLLSSGKAKGKWRLRKNAPLTRREAEPEKVARLIRMRGKEIAGLFIRLTTQGKWKTGCLLKGRNHQRPADETQVCFIRISKGGKRRVNLNCRNRGERRKKKSFMVAFLKEDRKSRRIREEKKKEGR